MSQSTSSSGSGAKAAQAGYEYQLNFAVLPALRLLLITKSAMQITLEPANEEDLEADCEGIEPAEQTARFAGAEHHFRAPTGYA